jgi:nitrogen-specific signal transduction histidine kinase
MKPPTGKTPSGADGEAALDAVIAYSERLAHDANNYIGAILGLAEVLPTVADDPERVILLAGKISAAGRLLQNIVNQPLLSHASTHAATSAQTSLDVSAAFETARLLAANLVPARIAFELTHSIGDAVLGVSRKEFAAMLFILLKNAVDAVGEGPGRIRVSLDVMDAAPIAGGEGVVYRRGVAPEGRHAVLRVADSGEGFPEGGAVRLFQPFVSHARRTTALGLGLTFAAAIAERRGGAIDVSRDGETAFSVLMPMAAPIEEKVDEETNDEDARIIIFDPLVQWGEAAATLFSALGRAAICTISAQATAGALDRASSAPHVVVMRASRGMVSVDDLMRLREALARRSNADLLIVVGADYPAHPGVASIFGDVAAILLGADAEPVDIVDYVIPDI